MHTMAVVLDSGVSMQRLGQGLVIGQRLKESIVVLQCVQSSLELVAIHAEQTERLLIGGLEILGVFTDSDDVARTRQLLWQVRAKKLGNVALSLLSLHTKSANVVVRCFVSGSGWTADAKEVKWTKGGNVCSKMRLRSARLNVRLGVEISGDAAPSVGGALERAAKVLGRKIEENVCVGSLRGRAEETELWTRKSGPIVYEDANSNLFIPTCVVAGWALLHPKCSDEEGAHFLLADLAASVETRVAVLLDELEAMQEESSEPQREHLLSRYQSGEEWKGNANRWTLPRRVLVRASSTGVPCSDWQMPGEYNGQATAARWLEILGVSNVRPQVIDGSLEPVALTPQISLFGGAGEDTVSSQATSPVSSSSLSLSSLNMYLIPVLIALVAVIIVIVTRINGL